MTAATRGVRLWLFRLATVLGSLLVGFLIAEGTIRAFPSLLNEKLRHAAFSKYDTLPGGIFRFEGLSGTRFMRADHRTRAYSRGYFWTHETDARGYRNPPGVEDCRALLLGDSIVYGHGVESDESIAHYLRTVHGIAAYDMSAQGQCLYDHYLALRLMLDELQPQTVLLFVYVNDINDLEQLVRAHDAPEFPELRSLDYEVLRERIEQLQAYRDPLMIRVAYSSAIVRMTAKTQRWRPARPPESTIQKRRHPQPESEPQRRPQPGNAMGSVLDDSRFRSIELYYETVLSDLANRCNVLGTRLVVIHLVPPAGNQWRQRDRAQTKLQRSLETTCSGYDLDFIDTGAFFEGRTDWILPGDGHLNPEGNRAFAGFLSHEVFGQPSSLR